MAFGNDRSQQAAASEFGTWLTRSGLIRQSGGSQLAFVMLALFGQMERTYAIERAARARAVAAAKGKRIGRPSVVDPAKLAHAVHLRDQEDQSISEIVKATGITRSSLYRYLPPRPPETLSAETQPND